MKCCAKIKWVIIFSSCRSASVLVCVADIIKESLCAYHADDVPQFKTVVAFDCRGVEPTDFEPRVRLLYV